MWDKHIEPNTLMLIWGYDNEDDIYIERPLAEVNEYDYNHTCQDHGTPRGVRKDYVYYEWVDQVS